VRCIRYANATPVDGRVTQPVDQPHCTLDAGTCIQPTQVMAEVQHSEMDSRADALWAFSRTAPWMLAPAYSLRNSWAGTKAVLNTVRWVQFKKLMPLQLMAVSHSPWFSRTAPWMLAPAYSLRDVTAATKVVITQCDGFKC
jgi:hypothetical protein